MFFLRINSSNIALAKNNETTQMLREETFGTAELASEKEQQKIDELYAKRLKLCVNYEKNRKEIASIDKKIKKLGAVELTSAEVETKMATNTKDGAVILKRTSIDVKVPRESYIKWTSTRRKMTYNGTLYEIYQQLWEWFRTK